MGSRSSLPAIAAAPASQHRNEVAPPRSVRSVRSAVVKRLLDVTIASALLIAICPLMLAIAVLVKLTSPGPVLFRQRRVGRDMQEFIVLKFRSMCAGASSLPHEEYVISLAAGEAAAEPTLKKLVDDPRITRVGRWLRRTSLDELPQLFNVLTGDMSIVGPRPALGYELDLYRPEHFERFRVLPGMTGLWQVSGRSRLGFSDMLDLDVEYARRANVRTYVIILLRTPVVLFTTG